MLAITRVAVIGAGAAGICASRFLAARHDIFDHVVYELSESIGGTWVYTDRTGKDEHGFNIHSSMYKYLCTNFPKELMGYPDTDFNPDLPSYVSHWDVKDYLDDYAQKYDVLDHVQFSTVVTKVVPVGNTANAKWEVTVRHLQTDVEEKHVYDAVFICNGHYSVPRMPDLPGADTFTGKILHSHSYREPSVFEGQTVVCLGAGPSGTDIGLEVATVASHVVLSHNNTPFVCPLPDNLEQLPGIEQLEGDTVVFIGGARRRADVVLFCTGYEYTYPFLSSACGVVVEEKTRVTPMFKHCINIQHPSMFLIGLPTNVVPLIIFHYQVLFALAVLEGTVKLPTKDQMLAEEEAELKKRFAIGWKKSYAHKVNADLLEEYLADLAKLGAVKPLPAVKSAIYRFSLEMIFTHLMSFKTFNYELIDDKNFKLVKAK
ncbi:PREDICTED: flavin-containing monooxygenase FMO GS-OX-like 2 [Priapulus caudatus]|uniref:Flavin-containing monooxygenase n=1 Tax=Priapulus caudatus TaxID=37621 RepID=A0ABM1DT86_PRICU|nr:PREDICTED: flavin-containing monooxygenase FMO GS-OX-like 2 [Priapulus caudatus]XP_014663158.1 PREDICTED: flavin-containing monooxygenase FMO GS-OX-like 2 [Priapulus caudatus]